MVWPIADPGIGFVDCSDHVETRFRKVLELVAQDPFTSLKGVVEIHHLTFQSGELFSSEKRLGEIAVQSSGAGNDLAILLRKLLKPEHRNDILEFFVLSQCFANLLDDLVMSLAHDCGGCHLGI